MDDPSVTRADGQTTDQRRKKRRKNAPKKADDELWKFWRENFPRIETDWKFW